MMIEEELFRIWQSSPNHERIKFERSKLMLEVQSKLDSFDRAVKRRDWIEMGAAGIMIPIFAYETYRQPNFLAKIGAFWIILYLAFVVFKLLNTKTTKPKEVGSYLEYLKQNKTYLEGQRNMLDTVLYWYILPALIGALIMMTGILDLFAKSWREIIGMKKLWMALPVFSGISVFILWINKRAVKKELNPRIEKVDELLKLLDQDDHNESYVNVNNVSQ